MMPWCFWGFSLWTEVNLTCRVEATNNSAFPYSWSPVLGLYNTQQGDVLTTLMGIVGSLKIFYWHIVLGYTG
jgi:hypothetical protein